METLRELPGKVLQLEQENACLQSKLERVAISDQRSKRGGPQGTLSESLSGTTLLSLVATQGSSTSKRQLDHWITENLGGDVHAQIKTLAFLGAYVFVSPGSEPSVRQFNQFPARVAFPNANPTSMEDSRPQCSSIEGTRRRHNQEDTEQIRDPMKRSEEAYALLMEKHLRAIKKLRQLKDHAKSWQEYYERKSSRSEGKTHSDISNTRIKIDKDSQSFDFSAPLSAVSSVSSLNPIGPTEAAVDTTDATHRTSLIPLAQLIQNTKTLRLPAQARAQDQFPDAVQNQENVSADPDRADDAIDARPPEYLASSTQAPSSPLVVLDEAPANLAENGSGEPQDDSDTPVIISERFLKRKRANGTSVRSSNTQNDGRQNPSNFTKPLYVKSEHGSSPILPPSSTPLDVTHDSLDLDEVGAHIFTPTKRIRMQNLLRSQGTKTALATGPIVKTLSECFSTSNMRDQPFGVMETNPNQKNQLQGEAYHTRLGQEYVQEDDQVGITRSSKGQKDPENRVPEALRGFENSRLARQYLHNQKVYVGQTRASENNIALTTLDGRYQPFPINPEIATGIIKEQSHIVSYGSPKFKSSPVHKAEILQSITPNARILPRTGSHSIMSKESSRRRGDSVSSRISCLAEDGEIGSHQRNTPRSAPIPDLTSKAPSTGEKHHRLQGLLQDPPPKKLPLSTHKSPKTKEDQKNVSSTGATSARASQGTITNTATKLVEDPLTATDRASSLPKNNNTARPRSARSSDASATNRSGRTKSPKSASAATQGSQTHLRARPLHLLHPDDFKINTAANQGLPFAFSEVTRGKDQRKSLPTCTKPSCCSDQFHNLVKIAGLPPPSKTRRLRDPSPSPPPATTTTTSSPGSLSGLRHTRAAEDTFLHDELGVERSALTTLRDAQRQELLVRAQAQKFARESGKHRVSGGSKGRAATPPGFWRTEFPTTQEEERDREEARRREGGVVEERWREAMRDGGRWVFRDE